MPKMGNNVDLETYQLLNAKLQILGADIAAAANEGMVFYNSAVKLARISNGVTIDNLTNLLEGVSGVGAISVGAIAAKSQAISIAAATGAVPGTMSAADFSKLAAATNAATASTLVLRDAGGNFSAGTITAALTGTASNAALLNGQAAAYYLARGNGTGSIVAANVSDFDAQVNTHALSALAAPTADVAMGAHKLTGLLDPTNPQDAATKAYVDSQSAGLDPKASVRLATIGNLAAATYTPAAGASGRGQITTAPNILDGVNTAVGNRVLVKDQTTGTGAADGIYVVTTVGTGANGVWDRAADFDTDIEVTAGAFTFVTEGVVNADTGWVLSTNDPITIGGAGGTVLAWSQFSAASVITAGNGLNKAGSVMSAVGTAGRISVGATIDIDAAYPGQATITTLGVVSAGTWGPAATPIAIASGGTGQITAPLARTALGAMGGYSTLLAGVGPAYTITHGLNNLHAICQVVETASGAYISPDVVNISATQITITFGAVQTSNFYTANVIG
jgi:hypothetical protein